MGTLNSEEPRSRNFPLGWIFFKECGNFHFSPISLSKPFLHLSDSQIKSTHNNLGWLSEHNTVN